MKNLAIILFLLTPFVAQAHTFTFDQCLGVTEWINVTVGARDQHIGYEVVDDAARVHMDAILKIKPQEAFILDISDDEMFFSLLERVYNSKQTSDEASTDFLNACVSRITPN